jgi:pimeloyl-ACP methyl ester carboxylesterase
VALIATHYEVDFSEQYLAEYMAARGYGFLGWNTRYRGAGLYFNLARACTDIGVGVRWLLSEGGAEAVVLVGNSGGASLMAAYHSGSPADTAGFVSLNAHPGRPDVLTAWLDPAVTDETDPLSVDPALDMFDPANGPPYAPEFVARYRAAQERRNHRISDWCRSELARLEDAGAWDRAFAVPRTWADLRFNDLTLDPSERAVGCYGGDARFANNSPYGLAVTNTCRSWLEMWSLADSPCRAAPHLATVEGPALVVQSTGDQGCFPSDATAIFDALGSADKELQWLPGAHYFETGGRDEVADLIAGWLAGRF